MVQKVLTTAHHRAPPQNVEPLLTTKVLSVNGCSKRKNLKRMRRRSVVDRYRDNSVQIVDRCRNMILSEHRESTIPGSTAKRGSKTSLKIKKEAD
ncbi:hypothetical protein Tco_0688284 [Tanacetum coccineum]